MAIHPSRVSQTANFDVVPANFCRALERELAAVRSERGDNHGEPSKEWLEGVWNNIRKHVRTVKAVTAPELGRNIEYEAVPLATVQFELGTFICKDEPQSAERDRS